MCASNQRGGLDDRGDRRSPWLCAHPALAVIVGGTIAAFRMPSAAVRSAVRHIASGVLFAALATDLLPDVMHGRMPVVTVLGFAACVAVMPGLKALNARWEDMRMWATGCACARASRTRSRWSGRWQQRCLGSL